MRPHLHGITLDGNMIESIEGFNKIYMPVLSEFSFGIFMTIQSITTLLWFMISEKRTGLTLNNVI